MTYKTLTPDFSVSPQIGPDDIANAAGAGFRSILSNRPDGEEPGQPGAADIASLASAHGLAFAHVPVVAGKIGDADVAAMRQALADLPSPVLAFCRSGARSEKMWTLAQEGAPTPGDPPASRNADRSYDIVIVGGGSGGIATAASLLRREPRLRIAIVEPLDDHYYQPGWTLVGAGVFRPEATRRAEAKVMPRGVDWLRLATTRFLPDSGQVELADGTLLSYRALVVATGIRLAWEAIPGLADTLGTNGVTSNYRYDLAPRTNELVRALKRGRALFTQPPMPIKCAGAPQKAMYLSCDAWRRAGTLPDIEVAFHSAAPTVFGVPAYVPALMRYIERYDIDLRLRSTLVAVNGPARVATFEETDADGGVRRVERGFDLLHAVPPQVAPGVVANGPLAGANGFVAVDEATLRHPRFANVFAVGDCAATSNAKTMAAARKQAPVVALNVLAALAGREPVAAYDGYGSCPLTVERGRIVLAEFGYGGRLLPTFPAWLLDGTRPSRLAWFLKGSVLPTVYWHAMLAGREWLAAPRRIPAAA